MSEVPEPGLPGLRELGELPLYARVAFAARCARRVEPLLEKFHPNAPTELVSAIRAAIKMAEQTARQGGAAAPLGKATGGYLSLLIAPSSGPRHLDHLVEVARSAERAAQTARGKHGSLTADADAYIAAANAARGAQVREPTVNAIHRDIELLTQFAKQQRWTDATPVDPDLLGPLWPAGQPEGWPHEPAHVDDISGIEVTIEVPDGMSEQESLRLVGDYLSRLNALHRALGGHGIRLSPPIEVTQSTPARVGA